MEKGRHYDVEMKGRMQKGGILICNLKRQMDKGGQYNLELKGWMQKEGIMM